MTNARIVKGSLALSSRECQPAEGGLDGLQLRGRRADTAVIMRTIGFRSNILYAVAAAVGIVASLARPWYAERGTGSERPLEDLMAEAGRAVTEAGGVTGWAALRTADGLLAGLAAASAALVLLTLAPSLQLHVRQLARWSALAAVIVVLVKLVDPPDGLGEPRHGILIALGCALALLASTATVAAAPARRRAPARRYTPPPAPAYEPEDSYGPPQF